MKRVPYEVMVNEFERVLTKYGFEPKDAKASAELFAQNSPESFLNAFPFFCGAADRSSFYLLAPVCTATQGGGQCSYIINIYYFSMVQFHTSLFN